MSDNAEQYHLGRERGRLMVNADLILAGKPTLPPYNRFDPWNRERSPWMAEAKQLGR
jgi:hypothetical protein